MAPTSMAVVAAVLCAHALLCGPPGRAFAGADLADHEVELARRDRARVGETRSLSLTIAPRSGYAIAREAPLVLKLSVPDGAGIALPKNRYRRRDAADPRADAPRFDLRYRAVMPGTHILQMSMRFWVCNRHTCRPVRVERDVSIEVSDEPAAGAPT